MNTNIEQLVKIAYDAFEDKKGIDIKILDISKVSTIADYFVIASGSNSSQVQALSDNVTEEMSKAGYDYKQIEGYNSSNWILIDYSDVIVHVFDADSRMFYDLERIWRDAEYVEL